MIVKIFPSQFEGAINAPSSKSSGQRACAAALLTPGHTVIENIGSSNDEKAAIGIIKKLGAEVQQKGNELSVLSNDHIFKCGGPQKNVIIDAGESGLSMRMFAPIAALFDFEVTFTGNGSLTTRPMDFFEKYLPPLEVELNTSGGKLPITIKGPLRPKNIRVDGALSSQFLTGLLFAFAKAASKPVTISVDCLQSKPYVDLTLDVLQKFGFCVHEKDTDIFEIIPCKFKNSHSVLYKVEGDWSNGAFLLVAAAINGNLKISGLDLNSPQGDKKIMDALYACGAGVKINREYIEVSNSKLKAFAFDATHCPDLFPPLVALASYCEGTSVINGVYRLLHKESNRGISLRQEFGKMGIEIQLEGDVMKVTGGRVRGNSVSSHNDHRIAMACAVAAIHAKGTTEIHKADAVNKSYPGFFEDLKKMKVNCSVSL